MKFKKAIFGLLLSTVLFAACSKNDDIDDVADKLQHRWALNDLLLYGGAPLNDTIVYYQGTSADYFDFRNNGKVYTNFNNSADTSNYRIIAGNKIVVDDPTIDTLEIKILTNSKLQFFRRSVDNSGFAQEATFNLKR